MFARGWPLVRKEFHELRRDRYMLIRLLVPPILQMLIFGYVATFDVSHVSTALLDRDHSQESRAPRVCCCSPASCASTNPWSKWWGIQRWGSANPAWRPVPG